MKTTKSIPDCESQLTALNAVRLPAPYTRYACDNVGNVYSMVYGRVKPIKQCIGNNGYRSCRLSNDVTGQLTYRTTHSLVALAFLGDYPEGKPVIRHLDGNPLNNYVGNLVYGTQAENIQDACRMGSFDNLPKGEDSSGARLTNQQVYEARLMRKRGFSFREIHEHFPEVTLRTLNSAVNGKSYRNAEFPV